MSLLSAIQLYNTLSDYDLQTNDCKIIILNQHEISMAADEGVRLLVEQSDGDLSPAQKTAAMKTAVEKRCITLRQKMGKLVAVANPELTDRCLQEVRCSHI